MITYRDVHQMIIDGRDLRALEAILTDDAARLTDDQISMLRAEAVDRERQEADRELERDMDRARGADE